MVIEAKVCLFVLLVCFFVLGFAGLGNDQNEKKRDVNKRGYIKVPELPMRIPVCGFELYKGKIFQLVSTTA